MTLQGSGGSSTNMDDEEETFYSSIDIVEMNAIERASGGKAYSYFGSQGT